MEEQNMATAGGLSEIGQISVIVKDVARARAFYQDVLGMKHLFDAPPQLAFFACGGVRLMLSPAEKPEFERPSSILYFRVKDVRDSHRLFVERGVRFEREPHMLARMPAYELWLAFFRDSEDNLLALMSELPIQG